MDPLADKLLVSSALICLIETGKLQAWIVLIIMHVNLLSAVSVLLRLTAELLQVIAASYWGKFKTVSHMAMIILLILDIQNPILLTITNIFVRIYVSLR